MKSCQIVRLLAAMLLPEIILAALAKAIIDDPSSFWVFLGIIYIFSILLWLIRTFVNTCRFYFERENMKCEISNMLVKLEFPLADFDLFSGDVEGYYEEVAFQESLPLNDLEMKRRLFSVGVLNTLSLLKIEGSFLGVRRIKKLHREAIRDLRSLRVADSLPA